MLFTRSSAVAEPSMVSVSEFESTLFYCHVLYSCIIILRLGLMHNCILHLRQL
jgi:hypothetical protein